MTQHSISRNTALSVIFISFLLSSIPDETASTTYHSKRAPPTKPTLLTDSILGTFEIIGKSGICSIAAVLLPNNYVMSIGKANDGGLWNRTSPGTITSLYDLSTNSFYGRNVKTSTWCSAGVLMPDGRLLSIGGAQDLGYGKNKLRFFRPCGKPGDPGICHWFESSKVVMQKSRWYPTAETLADGRIVIIQGNTGGTYGEQQFDIEFIPPLNTPKKTIYLPFLEDVFNRGKKVGDVNNLYPFVAVLPSGNLYIFSNKYSAILNTTNNDWGNLTPNYPPLLDYEGSNRKIEDIPSRTYNMSGTFALLPLDPANGYIAKIFICGGAKQDLGINSPALETCGMTTPEGSQKWDYSDPMPYGRIMLDVVLLPDETLLFLNGAAIGTAGVNAADKPIYEALIYDPQRPAGFRWRPAGISTIARMYHSVAVLTLDGTVWVSGSCPNNRGIDKAVRWPYEYRVEKYTPPYLLTNQPRPVILSNIPSKIGYNQPITFRATLSANLRPRVVVVNGGFKTHGNSMQQRLVVLRIVRFVKLSRTEYSITVNSPPRSAVAPPGYYLFFVVDQNGVRTPSVGRGIQIGSDPGNIRKWAVELAALPK